MELEKNHVSNKETHCAEGEEERKVVKGRADARALEALIFRDTEIPKDPSGGRVLPL